MLGKLRSFAEDAVLAAEKLLLYHKRLAKSDAAYGFFHQHDMLDHWQRYASTARIFREVDQLIADIDKLIAGYYDLMQLDSRFLIEGLDLPSSLERDFRLARNLFSLGFDDVGALVAGRGLEGVLREVARVRKISILNNKGKTLPASEIELYDLIEVVSHVRWKSSGIPLISSETKALLHYLRALRNTSAHASPSGVKAYSTPREMAVVSAATANRIWADTTKNKARLEPTTVPKTW
jgi:hypothetical protein